MNYVWTLLPENNERKNLALLQQALYQAELIFGLSNRVTAFNGWDSFTFYDLAAGCPGGVWGAVAVKGDFLVDEKSGPKYGLLLIGQPTGGLRKPFAPLKPDAQAEMKQLLKNAGAKTV